MKFNNQDKTKKGILIGVSVLSIILLLFFSFSILNKNKPNQLNSESEDIVETQISNIVYHNLINLSKKTNIAIDIVFTEDIPPYIEFLTPNGEIIGEWIENSPEIPYELYGNTLTYFLNDAIVGQWKIGYDKDLKLDIKCREYDNILALSELNYLRIANNELVISYLARYTSYQEGMFDIKISAIPTIGKSDKILLVEKKGELNCLSPEYIKIDKLTPNIFYKLVVELSPLDKNDWKEEVSVWEFIISDDDK